MVGRAFFLLSFLLVTSRAHGAYRVYELKLTYYDEKNKVVDTDVVRSTLDHLQYEHYHSGYRVLRAELKDTWYCPGATARRELCPKPNEKVVPTRGPASTNPKRILPYNRQPVIP